MKYELHKKSKIHSNGEGYITRFGHTMFQQDIVYDLNCLAKENERLRNSVDALHAGFNFKHLDDMERVAHAVRQELRIMALVKEVEELKEDL